MKINIFFYIILFSLSGCNFNQLKQNKANSSKNLNGNNREEFSFKHEGIINAVFKNYENGILNCNIKSKKVITDMDTNIIEFSKPDIDIQQPGNQTTIIAENGKYSLNDENIFLEKNVLVIKKKEDLKLYSDNLRWDRKNKKIIILGKVKQINGGNVVTGENLTADDDLNNIVIEKNVKVEIEKT